MDKILCVDDEPNILRSLVRVFRETPYEIIVNTDPVNALDQLKNENVKLIISDYRMENMNGLEFLRKSMELQPACKRIILSGFAQDDLVEAAIKNGEVHRYISKPFQTDELRDLIRDLMEAA